MGQPITERYSPVPVAANTAVQFSGSALGGFLCTTSGTITLVANASDNGQPSRTLINAMAVTAGVYYPLPFFVSTNGGTFTTAGGAIGLLGVV